MDHIPPFRLRLSLDYEFKKINAQFYANYQAWKLIKNFSIGGEDNEQYALPEGMPAWVSFNCRFSYQLSEKFKVFIGIDNILDTQYRVFASGINAPARNIFLTLKLFI
ncbi:MAG: TonB-dependent receptor [Cytophagales bacterium]|nr:MAG: TonB-dependent receptor [Cytophagales bacterium]